MKEKLIAFLNAHADCGEADPKQARGCYDMCYGVLKFLLEASPETLDSEALKAWASASARLYEAMYRIPPC